MDFAEEKDWIFYIAPWHVEIGGFPARQVPRLWGYLILNITKNES